MRERLTSVDGRVLSGLGVALSVSLLAVTAATLDASISTTLAPDPPESAPPAGGSLLALLYQLLDEILGVLGLTLGSPGGQRSGGSVLDVLIAVLQTVYRYRVGIVVGTVLLVTLGLFAQYRHALAVPRVLQSPRRPAESTTGDSRGDATASSWPPETDAERDVVREAWITMVRCVDDDVDAPASRTPAEWRDVAVANDLPADAVDTITATFRTVEYGRVTATAALRDRTRAALEELESHEEAVDE